MTVQEAEKILGVSEEDGSREIKQQFRKLMSRHHPDVLKSDNPEHLKRAQLINEAYAVLLKSIRENKRVNKSSTKKKPVWKGKTIKEAFTERTIYMSDGIWEETEAYYFEVVRGKYEWNPDLEEFHCLLHSLNQTSVELLEHIEQQRTGYHLDDDEVKELRFTYQVRLFHLLARQFISPVESLKKIVKSVSVDETGRKIYCFDASLGAQGSSAQLKAMEQLEQGDSIYVKELRQNKIMVSDKEGHALGYLSFTDDQLYYVVIPILQNHQAQVKCVIDGKQIQKNRRPMQARVTVKLYLRMEKEIKEENPANHNLKIAALLKEYETALAY